MEPPDGHVISGHLMLAEFLSLPPDLTGKPRLGLGRFDYALFLGVLYHLRHPLLVLDIVYGFTKELAVTLSDSKTKIAQMSVRFSRARTSTKLTSLAAILTIGLGQRSNLFAFCRAAGFARVELREIRRDKTSPGMLEG